MAIHISGQTFLYLLLIHFVLTATLFQFFASVRTIQNGSFFKISITVESHTLKNVPRFRSTSLNWGI